MIDDFETILTGDVSKTCQDQRIFRVQSLDVKEARRSWYSAQIALSYNNFTMNFLVFVNFLRR